MPKPSVTSPPSTTWRPTLFLDATHSSARLATILRASGWTVELHSVHFKHEPDIPDYKWVVLPASRGWAIITADANIRSWRTERGLVRTVLESHKAKVFFVGGNLDIDAHANTIALARVGICRTFKNNLARCCFSRLHTGGNQTGKVQSLTPNENETSADRTRRKYGNRVG